MFTFNDVNWIRLPVWYLVNVLLCIPCALYINIYARFSVGKMHVLTVLVILMLATHHNDHIVKGKEKIIFSKSLYVSVDRPHLAVFGI